MEYNQPTTTTTNMAWCAQPEFKTKLRAARKYSVLQDGARRLC